MFGQLSNRESLRDLIVAFAKTTFASANQNRDYRIFEDFAFYMIDQARKKLVTDIFKLKGNVYAFDSTTIPLYLSVLWWAKFRKKNGGVRAYVLYDLESQVPAFFHISNLIDNHSLLPCCYQGNMICKRSTYEVLQILSISLMDKTPLVDIFKRTDFNNVKELDCPFFPGLFD